MPNTAQINHYMISHGVKDQLLAMFDQALSSNRLDDYDHLYVKSVFDLTYLVRGIATEAVRENAENKSRHMLPFEENKEIDCEVLKIYWHFFNNQNTVYGDLNARYSSIELLKTIGYLLQKSSAIIENPYNIPAALEHAGVQSWGKSFIDIDAHEKNIESIKDEIRALDAFQSQFDKALSHTNAYRSEEHKILNQLSVLQKQLNRDDNEILGDEALVRSVANSINVSDAELGKLSKLIFFTKEVFSNPAQEAYAERLKVAYKDIIKHSHDISYLKRLALTAHRVEHNVSAPKALYQSMNAHKVFDQLSSKFEKIETAAKQSLESQKINFNIHTLDKKVKKLLETNSVYLTVLENDILNLIQSQMGIRLNQLDQKTYDALEPSIVKTIDEDNIVYLEQYLGGYTNLLTIDDIKAGSHPSLHNILKCSRGEPIKLSAFEQRMLSLIEEKLGYRLAFMYVEDFAVLQPIVSSAFEQNKISEVSEAFYTFVDQDEFEAVSEYGEISQRIDMTKVNPALNNMLEASLIRSKQDLKNDVRADAFELSLLDKIESKLGFPLANMDQRSFEGLQPYLLSAIESQDMDQMDKLLAVKYAKKPFVVKDIELSHDTLKSMLWPSSKSEDVVMENKLNEVKSLFTLGEHFKRTEKTSFNDFKHLFSRPEMRDFYLGFAVKMCSYTQSLINKRPLLGESINLEEVNPEFKSKTMDLVFKFASFANVLQCDSLTMEESELLQAAVEKTVNLIYSNFPDPYLPMAKWTMKRFEKIQGKETADIDMQKLALFSAAYSMDFKDPKEHLLLQLADNGKYKKLQNKLDMVGGFQGLTKPDRQAFVKVFNNSQPAHRLYDLDEWVSKKLINNIAEKESLTDTQTINQQFKTFSSLQDYDESAKKFILEYYVKRESPRNNKAYLDFVAFNEILFQKPLYAFSNARVMALTDMVSPEKIDYEAWRIWLDKPAQQTNLSKSLDVKALYDAFALKDNTPKTKQTALTRVLDFCKKSQREDFEGHFSPNLTLIEEKFKSSTLDFTQLSQIINHKIVDFDDVPSFSSVASKNIHSLGLKSTDEIDSEIKHLLATLETSNALPNHIYKELIKKDNVSELPNIKTRLANLIDKDPTRASVLLEAEKQMKTLGYQTDFTEKTIEDLSAYHVFFTHFNSALKEGRARDYLQTNDEKQFSPKVIREALLAHRKELQSKLAIEENTIDQFKEKNAIVSNFVKDLMMVNTAFVSVDTNKSFDEIQYLESFELPSYNREQLVPMMTGFMTDIKHVDLMDEQSLANIIKVLRVLQDIKTFGAEEVKLFFPTINNASLDQLQKRFGQLKDQYFVNVHQDSDKNKASDQSEFGAFIKAIRALQNKSFETESEFNALSKNSYFNLSINKVFDALTVEQAVDIIAEFSDDEKEKGVMLQALDANKKDQVMDVLKRDEELVDIDIEEVDYLDIEKVVDHEALISKILFSLSRNHANAFDALLKTFTESKHSYQVMNLLERQYIDHLRSDAQNEKDKTIINVLETFAISGPQEMFIEYMMYLLPKNTDRTLLDQLIAQFAPSWNYKFKSVHNRDTLDTALSALLLSHHGAHKLVVNNVEYHLPIQLAWLSMIVSFALFITSILLWAWPLQVVFGCSFFASIFMRIYIEHLINMALEPYAISDQRGLVESPSEVDAIYAKYDNIEAKLVMRLLEDLQLLKDSEPFKKFGIGLDKRLNDADLIKINEYEKRFNIEPKEDASVLERFKAILPNLKTLLERKIFLKEIVPSSSIVLSDKQYEKIIQLKHHVQDVMGETLPFVEDDEKIKNILYSQYKSENIQVSSAKLNMLYDFMLMQDSVEKTNIQLENPMKDLGDLESAKLLSAIDRIKKIKAQMEIYSESNDYFPSYDNLLKIDGISKEDVAFLKKEGIKSFSALKNLVDPTDYSGTGFACEEYNQGIVDLIENHMRSSGESLRVVNKIRPMTMFGSLKLEVDEKDKEHLFEDQSSFSLTSPVRM